MNWLLCGDEKKAIEYKHNAFLHVYVYYYDLNEASVKVFFLLNCPESTVGLCWTANALVVMVFYNGVGLENPEYWSDDGERP